MRNTYCIFSALYLPHVGGVENYTQNLARELTALGNDVIIVTCNTEGAPAVQTTPEAMVFRLPCHKALKGRFPLIRENAECKKMLASIEKLPINKIVVNTRFYPLSVMGVQFAARKGIVPILIEHGSAHLTIGQPTLDKAVQSVEHSITEKVKKHPVRFYGVSAKAVEWLCHFGIKGEGILSNSIDAETFRSIASDRDFREEFDLDPEKLTIGFTGRLVPEKGIHHLVAAASDTRCKNMQFLIAGNGPLFDELSQTAPANVKLLGSLSRPDVSAMLSLCDAFCMPTRSEGFSTSLLEAASHGLALVSTNVGGVDELIPSKDFGIVLPNAQPESIVTALSILENDMQAARAIGANAKQRVEENFNWAKIAQQVEDIS